MRCPTVSGDGAGGNAYEFVVVCVGRSGVVWLLSLCDSFEAKTGGRACPGRSRDLKDPLLVLDSEDVSVHVLGSLNIS